MRRNDTTRTITIFPGSARRSPGCRIPIAVHAPVLALIRTDADESSEFEPPSRSVYSFIRADGVAKPCGPRAAAQPADRLRERRAADALHPLRQVEGGSDP